LIKAYKRSYREQNADPLGLKIAGESELKYLTEGVPGVEYFGFVQPEKMFVVMKNTSFFVLPILWEP